MVLWFVVWVLGKVANVLKMLVFFLLNFWGILEVVYSCLVGFGIG